MTESVCYWCGAKDSLNDVGKELDNGKYKMVQCKKCQTKYYVKNNAKPQTNEEWFCSLPTKNKAEVLNRMTTACYVCGQDGVDFKRCPFGMDCTGQEDIEDWLKQKHIDIREE